MLSHVWQGDWPITQDYGPTTLAVEPIYRGHHFHCGIDIGMPSGTPIFAARAGTVTKRTFGILGILTTSGQTDYYVHGDYSVLLGAKVAAKARLGASGARVPGGGSLTGPHLHFETQGKGGWINNPATSLDPNPILFPTFSGGRGNVQGDDMTPDEHKTLYLNLELTRNLYFALGLPVNNPADPATAKSPILADFKQGLADLKTAIAQVPAAGVPADNKAVLEAVANIQAKLDKHLT